MPQQGTSQTDFNQWYCSNDNRKLAHWQQRIASSVVILQANQLVDDWLMQAEQLVTSLPLALQSVTAGLVESVKKTTLEKNQCRIA